MKLLNKTSLYYFLSSLILLVIFGGLLYWRLKKEVSAEIKEQLELEIKIVLAELKEERPVNHPFILITKADRITPDRFRDTSLLDPVQDQLEGYYALTSSQKIGSAIYQITVITAYIGWDEYYKTIGFTILGLILLLLITAGLVNYFISRQIWRPFLNNLLTLKSYTPSSGKDLTLKGSDITEFDELNEVLIDLAERSRSEYLALQEFTENSSHELQTPIAIIRGRLESLSQRSVDTEGIRYLNDAKNAIDRLSKVNKSLLLLAKLRNGSFPDMQTVKFDVLLKDHLEQLQDLFANRDLEVYTDIRSANINASLYLTDVLISNLLSNQFKFATEHSLISIHLDQDRLAMANEAPPLSFPENELFKRFVKGRDKSTGSGLGLSIAQQICALHQWDISYHYQQGRHTFTVNFRKMKGSN